MATEHTAPVVTATAAISPVSTASLSTTTDAADVADRTSADVSSSSASGDDESDGGGGSDDSEGSSSGPEEEAEEAGDNGEGILNGRRSENDGEVRRPVDSVDGNDSGQGESDNSSQQQQPPQPMGVVDVAETLQERFALLTGGRDRRGRWLITFPETNRPDPGAASFARLIAYLVRVAKDASRLIVEPSASNVVGGGGGAGGELVEDKVPEFYLVVDRRHSNWSRVLSCVGLILSGFPPSRISSTPDSPPTNPSAKVTSLVIIRPAGVLAGLTRSHYVSRLTEQLASAPFPATVVDEPAQLESAVDAGQLCCDLGGRLPYCHDAWIERRAAVESYARHAGSIVATVASVGRRLAAEPLADRMADLLVQVKRQEQRRDEMLKDLESAKEHGDTLLANIERCSSRHGNGQVTDHFGDAASVAAVLGRVADAEAAFRDAESTRRQGPVARQLAAVALADEAARVADSLTQRMSAPAEADTTEAERLLQEAAGLLAKAEALERRDLTAGLAEVRRQAEADTERRRLMHRRNAELQDLAQRTEDWSSLGFDLLARSDVDSSQLDELLCRQPSLSNLDTLSDLMAPPALRTRLATLASRAQTLGTTLARQRDDLRLAAATAAAAEKTLTGRPDKDELSATLTATIRAGQVPPPVGGSNDDIGNTLTATTAVASYAVAAAAARRHGNPALQELVSTEQRYVEDLQRVWDAVSSDEAPPAELAGDARELLANWPDLLAFHRDCLLPDLLAAACEADVAECFLRHCDRLQVYQQYCLNKPAADSLLARLGRGHPFLQRCETLLHLADDTSSSGSAPLPLSAYLLKPVQRVQKYQLLLAEMQRACPAQRAALGRAVDSLLAALSVLNDSMALAEVDGLRRTTLTELGRVLMHADFQVIEDGKLIASSKPRRAYLFSGGVLLAKRLQASQTPARYAPTLVARVSEMGLNSQPSGGSSKSSDKRRFQLTFKQQPALTLQAASGAVKALWVAEIERVLWSHFASLKAEAVRRQQQQQQLQQEPSSPASPDGLEAVVDFASQDAAMLPLRRGEFLLALNTDSESYWLVENQAGRRGYAHRQYLRPSGRMLSGGSTAAVVGASGAGAPSDHNGSGGSNGASGLPRRGSVVTTSV